MCTSSFNPIPLYILAGGHSSRFGGDKALAMVGRRTMIEEIAAQWSAWAYRVTVVADREGKYGALGLRTIADRRPGLGPLGGLLTALEDCGDGWLILAACDAILLDMKAPGRMLAGISNDVQAVALKGCHWETMPALYHCSILPVVKMNVAQGQSALWKIIEQVSHRAVAFSEGHPAIAQINTREDLQEFLATRRS